jgi:hypothetical protein
VERRERGRRGRVRWRRVKECEVRGGVVVRWVGEGVKRGVRTQHTNSPIGHLV